MGNDPRGLWYQVHALHLRQGLSPRRSGGRVCWNSVRRGNRKAEHGWKISRCKLLTRTFVLEGIRRWCNELQRIWCGVSSDISWKYYNWEILEIGLLSHKQWGRVWNSVGRDDHGLEYGWKSCGSILEFKTGCRTSSRRVRSQGSQNAGVLELG